MATTNNIVMIKAIRIAPSIPNFPIRNRNFFIAIPAVFSNSVSHLLISE